jgi:hypothetical protein
MSAATLAAAAMMRGGNMTGGSGNNSGGLATSSAAGINYSDSWNKHLDVSGNYNFNRTATENNRNSYRQNFLPIGTITDSRNAFSKTAVQRTPLRLPAYLYINERNSIIYTPTLPCRTAKPHQHSIRLGSFSD